MTKQSKTKWAMAITLVALAMTQAACGGGGGGGGGGTNPPPPPPPAGITYTLALTDVTLTDRRSTAVTASGLPVKGAVATRNP